MSASIVWMNCRKPRRRINATHLRRFLSLSSSPPYLSLTQEDLWKLPKARFPGECIVVSTLEDERTYSDAIETLFHKTVLGFDTEWSPWRPRRLPSLVQLASEDVCVMWRLCYQNQENLFVGEKFPPRLLRLLTSKKITKVGHASSHDAFLLLKQYYVNMSGVFDTYPLTKELQLPMESLRGLTGTMLGMQLTKSQSMTNWENRVLSDHQLRYASTDAWVSLEVYKSLIQYAALKGVKPSPAMRSTFEMVSDPRHRTYLRKKVKRAKMLRAELKRRSLQKGSQRTPSEPSVEPRRPQGILERIRDVINQLLTKIEAAEQSSLTPLSDTKERLIEKPLWPFDNRNTDIDIEGFAVIEDGAPYKRQPVASLADGRHVDRSSNEKVAASELSERRVVEKNENSCLSYDNPSSEATSKNNPNWTIVASCTAMEKTVSHDAGSRLLEYKSVGAEGERVLVEKGESSSSREDLDSKGELVLFATCSREEAEKDVEESTTDRDIEPSDRLTTNLAPL